ncbi:MAG: hypothetical protein IPF87_04735 [Gemmatimonadetes bacterium]|nr:hypothetical protein [Gemmatimonadota bacterium]MBK7835243.1 hypothetical protein [Gemmatimonadota bacterium]MBK8645295.1 hypothetical protein [Gemmatimonadota bacterium]MBK9406583.1 hypothetical protein [Gemmatimonadota bacterium]
MSVLARLDRYLRGFADAARLAIPATDREAHDKLAAFEANADRLRELASPAPLPSEASGRPLPPQAKLLA